MSNAEPEQTDPVGSEFAMYGSAGAPGARPVRGRASSFLAFGMAVVVLAGVVGLATVPARSGGHGATGTPSSTSVPVSVTTTPGPDGAITAGAPTDGKASKRLPVRLTPDRDLVDGQVVGIHGSGFTPGAQVGIVICTNAAQTQGSAACDLGNYALSTPDADGEVQGLFTVRRFITVAGRQVDCLEGTIDPAAWVQLVVANGGRNPDYPSFTCGAVIGEVGNYDNSGGWPIGMRGAVFKPLEPPGPDGPSPSPTSTTSLAPSPTTAVPPAPAPPGRTCPASDPTVPLPTTTPRSTTSTPGSVVPATTSPPPEPPTPTSVMRDCTPSRL